VDAKKGLELMGSRQLKSPAESIEKIVKLRLGKK
jgi:hypothetical protein